MQVSSSLPVLIICERGMGKLRPEACGRRWAIAHDRVEAKGADRALVVQVKDSPCRTCTYGEARLTSASVDAFARDAAAVVGKWGGLPEVDCKKCLTPFKRTHPAQKVCGTCKASPLEAKARKQDDKGKFEALMQELNKPKAAERELAVEHKADAAPEADAAVAESTPSTLATETMKVCQHVACSKSFPAFRNKRFCSEECGAEDARIRRNLSRAEVAGRDPLELQERVCKACEKTFRPKSGNERYCASCKDVVPLSNRGKSKTAAADPQELPPLELERKTSESNQGEVTIRFARDDKEGEEREYEFVDVPDDLSTHEVDRLYRALHARLQNDAHETMHVFTLREGWPLTVVLPNDLGSADVARLTQWLNALAID